MTRRSRGNELPHQKQSTPLNSIRFTFNQRGVIPLMTCHSERSQGTCSLIVLRKRTAIANRRCCGGDILPGTTKLQVPRLRCAALGMTRNKTTPNKRPRLEWTLHKAACARNDTYSRGNELPHQKQFVPFQINSVSLQLKRCHSLIVVFIPSGAPRNLQLDCVEDGQRLRIGVECGGDILPGTTNYRFLGYAALRSE